jgi:hypothetical protein
MQTGARETDCATAGLPSVMTKKVRVIPADDL